LVTVHAMKAYRRSGDIAPLIIHPGNRCRWVGVTTRSLYSPHPQPPRERTTVPLFRRQGGRSGEETKLLLKPGCQPRTGLPAALPLH